MADSVRKQSKTAIVYCSKHHGNTRLLLDTIATKHEVTLIDARNPHITDLSGFDLVGFASGIYFWSFHRSVINFAKKNLPMYKRVFLLFTYGSEAMKSHFCKKMFQALFDKHAVILGKFGCLGQCTVGPFKLIGGTAKGHPDELDVCDAMDFYESLQQIMSGVFPKGKIETSD
ncbi:MAG: hypothetical protein J6X55_11505 [Victivallales bacterium]|nr:hypothetical protein [Victivallales bacterium]